MNNKIQSIDEYCGQPNGTFKNFIEMKQRLIKEAAERRRARICAKRKGLPAPEITISPELLALRS